VSFIFSFVSYSRHTSATAMEGGSAENAGAFFCQAGIQFLFISFSGSRIKYGMTTLSSFFFSRHTGLEPVSSFFLFLFLDPVSSTG